MLRPDCLGLHVLELVLEARLSRVSCVRVRLSCGQTV